MNFLITDNAAKRAHQIISKQAVSDTFLRITVSGGGCQGFQYDYSLDTTKSETDHIFINNNATIVIDDVSLPFLDGSQLDWVSDLTGESFQISNPNASSECGCGVSFSI